MSEERRVTARSAECAARYRNNEVTNSQYNLITFLPKNLYEQFSKPLNLYFLIIAILQFIPVIAPVHPLTTVGPLAFAFGLTACKEAHDDWKRHKEDAVFNERVYTVFNETGEHQTASKDIRVGDIVRVNNGQEIPCDLFLISSSDDDGLAYIRTDNLDGEIDLKPRQALEQVLEHTKGHDAQRWTASVACEPPNKRLYHFNSRLELEAQVAPASAQQLLLQSCFLQNTEYAYGMAVYTGGETKCGMNKMHQPAKWAALDQTVSRASICVFCFQLVVAFTMGIIGQSRRSSAGPDEWYLFYEDASWYHALIIPMRFFLLTSVMIPISFKVVIDISKYYISLAIGWDVEMYSDEIDPELGGCPARANNTAIAEDLGQVQYIMTDKTGTLTENVMEFRLASINSCVYSTSGELPSACAQFKPLGSGDRSLNVFARHLALCHTVSVKDGIKGNYSSASPDEEALVRAAVPMGVELTNRTKREVVISAGGGSERHEVLHICEFTSDRKMMSILLRGSDGAIMLFSKGADDRMLSRLARDIPQAARSAAEQHLSAFAATGLRTLVLGQRRVTDEEYAEWRTQVDAALALTGDERELQLHKAYEAMERGLALVGCTAIEDKLQEGVPETIATLREAGISFWMLTGDKFETARQIARSCNLWAPGEQLHTIRASQRGQDCDVVGALRQVREELPPLGSGGLHRGKAPKLKRCSSLERGLMDVELTEPSPASSPAAPASSGHCLIIEGHALELLLEHSLDARLDLLEAGFRCNSVVCCRVTPDQKAKVTRLVKGMDEPSQYGWAQCLDFGSGRRHVLSVGDGGNDVSMIQQATVGVGIVGKEGRQASRAADFSIARFRFLLPLLLVHGHCSFARSAYITQYCFYKSMLIAWTQQVYNMVAGFSGVSYWNSMLLTAWNGVYTLPGPFFYVLDRVFPRDRLLSEAPLYYQCQQGLYLTRATFVAFLIRGVVQSVIFLVLYTLVVFSGDYISAGEGLPMDFDAICTVTYTSMLLGQSWTLVLESHTLTWLNMLNIVGMPFVYLISLAIYSAIPRFDYYGVVPRLLGESAVWLSVIAATASVMMPHTLYAAWKYHYGGPASSGADRRSPYFTAAVPDTSLSGTAQHSVAPAVLSSPIDKAARSGGSRDSPSPVLGPGLPPTVGSDILGGSLPASQVSLRPEQRTVPAALGRTEI